MQSFVIEFNRRTRVRRVRHFDTVREAVRYRIEQESRVKDPDVEIAALTSQSLEALMSTHSRYFTGAEISDPVGAQLSP